MVSPSKEHLEKHYSDLSDKPFFKGLVTCKVDNIFLIGYADRV
jgi:nucleoside diphosphate kinase